MPPILPAGFVAPCQPSSVKVPPVGADWLHEVKHDGFRLMVQRAGACVRLFTRNGHDWAARYPAITVAAAALQARLFLIDGEAVVFILCSQSRGTANLAAIHAKKKLTRVFLKAATMPSAGNSLEVISDLTWRSSALTRRRINVGALIMTLHRRDFLRLAAGAAVLPATTHRARALDYPTRPVHLIEGFGAGTGTDIAARFIGEALSERLGRPFVIENRTGSSSNIATDHVVRATPDGYTLLLLSPANAINATMYNLSFDLTRDLAPVAGICQAPLVMEVHPSVPAKTVAEFVAYAKSRPGKINLASAGTGTTTHMAGEMFKTMAGLDLFHVPYRGAQVVPAMLAGEAQVFFGPLLSSIGYIRAGNLRPLAVTSTTRAPQLPEVPSLAETFAGFDATVWFGIAAPRDTPPEIIARLSTAVGASLADDKFQARLANIGATVLAGSPADFAKLIADEINKWGKVVVAANLKVN